MSGARHQEADPTLSALDRVGRAQAQAETDAACERAYTGLVRLWGREQALELLTRWATDPALGADPRWAHVRAWVERQAEAPC